MHPYDVANPPTGEGWIVQIVGHHYNPYPIAPSSSTSRSNDPERVEFGPYQFLTEKVLQQAQLAAAAALRRQPRRPRLDDPRPELDQREGERQQQPGQQHRPAARPRLAPGRRRGGGRRWAAMMGGRHDGRHDGRHGWHGQMGGMGRAWAAMGGGMMGGMMAG